MSDILKRIDEHIEFHEAIDSHKSDVAFLEEIKAYIGELEKVLNFISCDVIELPDDINTADELRAWAEDAVYCSCMHKP